MNARLPIWIAMVSLAAFPAMAPSADIGDARPQSPQEPVFEPLGGAPRFDSGSDGSDGAFNPLSDVEIDLSLAATASWDTPSPVPGQGVYDADQWVVVFKYTTIDIPAGVTVTFSNHPKNPPVIWLASGDVNIAGTVSLNGQNGGDENDPAFFAQPGPGGFEGGQRGWASHGILRSAGCGPGGGWLVESHGGSGGYGTPGQTVAPGIPGDTYGNEFIMPLIGGSGGGAGDPYGNGQGGGAGAGAILIASSGAITLDSTGLIEANGGGAPSHAGGGSGGAIRLIANTISGAGALRAYKGTGHGNASAGRIRVEAVDITLTDPGSPTWVSGTPGPVFPPADAPTLRATAVDTVAVPTDPDAGIMTSDLSISSLEGVTVEIEATNIPAGATVNVIVVPAHGQRAVYVSDQLVDNGGGVLTASAANVFIPPGRAEIQLRANWTP